MRAILSAGFLLLFLQAGAQADRKAYDAAAAALMRQYNAGAYDSIFLQFSPSMQASLPLAATTRFFSDLKAGAGKIDSLLLSTDGGTYVVYRSRYERAALLTRIALAPDGRINALVIRPDLDAPLPPIARARTVMSLPVSGEWFVFWGGDNRKQNYHVASPAQQGAFDLLMAGADGRSYRGDGKRNEDYLAFGQPVFAPCDGEVLVAADGIADNVPHSMNPKEPMGNSVVLRSDAGEYVLLAHFRQGSVAVRAGQRVKKGTLLGACGNSGNSSEAHLHLHIQDGPDGNIARGRKCYFDKIRVNGDVKTDYSPVRGERIRPE